MRCIMKLRATKEEDYDRYEGDISLCDCCLESTYENVTFIEVEKSTCPFIICRDCVDKLTKLSKKVKD